MAQARRNLQEATNNELANSFHVNSVTLATTNMNRSIDNTTDILKLDGFIVHKVAQHTLHASRFSVGVWFGVLLGTFVASFCFCVCLQCVCGRGLTLSSRPKGPKYEGLPLITI